MAGFSTTNNSHLIRSNVWDSRLKELQLDELFATKYVDWITDFPDGDTLNMPTIGQMETLNYSEGQAVRYTAIDTGNFTFTIGKYKSSGTYITEKMKQDTFYMSRLVSSFVPKQHRAISKAMEVDLLAVGNAGQTASNLNAINSGNHRYVAGGTSQVFIVDDVIKANYSLDMANYPRRNRIAIVHPSVEVALSRITNITNLSNNPMWEGIVDTGLSTGMHYLTNIFGVDFYVSQNLPLITAGETINSVSVNTSGVANYIFCADSDVLPFVGCVRQPPKVDSKFNQDLQREEFVTTCRYDFKLYRPDNLVTILSATDQV